MGCCAIEPLQLPMNRHLELPLLLFGKTNSAMTNLSLISNYAKVTIMLLVPIFNSEPQIRPDKKN